MQPPKVKRNILLNPGPATTTDSVKHAMVVPDICPREAEFQHVLQSVCQDLAQIAGGGDYVTVMLAGSGTAGMDACINSAVPPSKKILVVSNGAYGERLCEIARAYQIGLVEFACPWDQTPDLAALETALQADADIACVAMVHHETTTGLLNPLAEVGALAKRYGKTYIVDAISSFAGIPFNAEENHIDFLIGTSNKCIQGMAGLAFVICRRQAIAATAHFPLRSYYLNLYKQYDYMCRSGQMQFTPPVQVVYALQQAIREFFAEGAEQRYARYTRSWQALRAGIEGLGFRCLLRAEQEARILITVIEPDFWREHFLPLHEAMLARGFTIYPGKLKSVQRSFRLSVLGAIDEHDIRAFLRELDTVLNELGIHPAKAGQRS